MDCPEGARPPREWISLRPEMRSGCENRFGQRSRRDPSHRAKTRGGQRGRRWFPVPSHGTLGEPSPRISPVTPFGLCKMGGVEQDEPAQSVYDGARLRDVTQCQEVACRKVPCMRGLQDAVRAWRARCRACVACKMPYVCGVQDAVRVWRVRCRACVASKTSPRVGGCRRELVAVAESWWLSP